MRDVVGVFVVIAMTALTAGTAFALKVQPNPATLQLTEGAQTTVQFTLDAPIIAATPNPNVTLDFTVDDPTRVSLDTSSVVWQDNEWPQIRTIHVTAIHDGVHDSNDTVTVHATATSASEYYDGFDVVRRADHRHRPGPTTTTSSSATTSIGGRDDLPATGSNTPVVLVFAFGAIATGAGPASSRRRRVTR